MDLFPNRRRNSTYPFTPIVNPSAKWNGILKNVRLGISLILICFRSSSILVMEIDSGRREVLSSSTGKVSAGKTDCISNYNLQDMKIRDRDYRVKP
jgi:hypothetical protein